MFNSDFFQPYTPAMRLEMTFDEYRIIRKGLMELPGREMYSLLLSLDQQAGEQLNTEQPQETARTDE